ncbi:class I SAM-dependent methyltransferase [Sporobolomyces salmoneus]|uniref:class I SAM-dependent methyltransferase n=1 Tax=Sporobolomyces salmoneus TaxID=183962 RepID=UPI003177DBA9
MATKAILLGTAGASIYFFDILKRQLDTYTHHSPTSGYVLAVAISTIVFSAFASTFSVALTFAWNCFLKPLGKTVTQEGRLNSFYEGQASIYDKTRARLLRGRTTMLRLSAAHLREQRKRNPSKKLVWVDVGGATGWTIEEMNKYFPISEFDAVYVVDLCGPLLEVSRKRFEAKGWKNVHCLLQDATTFVLPEWTEEGIDANEGGLDFVTMSYSLSMMPDYLTLLDRIDRLLSPIGLLSVADFYVSTRETSSMASVIGDVASRQCSYWSRLFWQHWFELDHVDLHPSRRAYVEHRFATIKSFNSRNGFILPGLISIPYYVSLHTSRRIDTSKANQAYEVDAGNTISASPSPLLRPTASRTTSGGDIPDLALGLSAALSRVPSSRRKTERAYSRSSDQSDSVRIDVAPEQQLSAFHYGLKHYRVPYLDDKQHREFRTWIYGFTWEDPAVDMQHLNLTENDSILCITSAGDNALHYAIDGNPRRIHTVDFNPCQGHVLELKLACINSLEYEDFWLMFGEGKHPRFRELLDTKMSPFLSSHAYQFWRKNDKAFSDCFYLRGYSGHALRLAKVALYLTGMSKVAHEFCAAKTLDEQKRIWDDKLRPVLLSKLITKVFLSNPAFLWNALGVPINQANVFLSETTTEQFAIDTLDPVAYGTHIANGAYHYQLCLEGRYTKKSCPLYLTRAGFESLKAKNGAALDCFRLHTDSINNVLNRLAKENSLTICVIMDLQDWFDNTISSKSKKSKKCALTETIRALHGALVQGGRVFFRSAGQKPWYLELYRREGFEVECIHKRPIGGKEPIDRVNMYASFYRCTKL